MVAHDGVVGSSAIGKWSKALGALHERIGHRFARSEARECAHRYLRGLLARVERKNGLATRRGHRGARPAGRPAPAELSQVGRRRGTRRPQGVRGRALHR